MSKTHVVLLTIGNYTGKDLLFADSWFHAGEVAARSVIPEKIHDNQRVTIEMYETGPTVPACSGYIEFSTDYGTVAIAFSNPASGRNKVGCGINGKLVWEKMGNHDYKPFLETFSIATVNFVATEFCTGGDVNSATVLLSTW